MTTEMMKNAPELDWNQAKILVQTAMVNGLTVYVEGSPGCGKTAMIDTIVEELGADGVTLTCSMFEPSDVFGMPNRRPDGSVEFTPIGVFARILSQPEDQILYVNLDDIGHARADVQAALWPMLSERRIGSHPLPKSVRIVMTGNRTSDAGAGARAMLLPMIDRVHVRVAVKPSQKITLAHLRPKFEFSPYAVAVLDAAAEVREDRFLTASSRTWQKQLEWMVSAERSGLDAETTALAAWPLASAIDVRLAIEESTGTAAIGRLIPTVTEVYNLSTPGIETMPIRDISSTELFSQGVLVLTDAVQEIYSGGSNKKAALAIPLARKAKSLGIFNRLVAAVIAAVCGGIAAAELHDSVIYS